ncbi:MAG TPA: hypothetical protein VLN45_07310, partial [Ignavibacteriaceae bacterium]|nr:hypothetical protein [Ignavibacteriaceae bacterium]
SCGSESYTQQEQSEQKNEQTLTFTDEENGNQVHYKVNFNEGKISSIYKDNIKIPENEIENYEDLVYDKLNYMSKDDDDFFHHPKPFVYHFDTDDFKDHMKEFKGKHFNFKFDHDKFSADMEKLKEELKDMDEIVIEIDRDKIKKDLDESLKHLDKLKIHKFNFDDEFDKKIIIELDRNRDDIELNMKELEEEMEKLEEEMGELSEEMKDLDKDMKTLDKFLDTAKSELVKDGLIKSKDEDFDFELNEKEMKVNDEKVSDQLHLKYKEMYKEHFNKELEGSIKIKI